jgi:hypothetical protein
MTKLIAILNTAKAHKNVYVILYGKAEGRINIRAQAYRLMCRVNIAELEVNDVACRMKGQGRRSGACYQHGEEILGAVKYGQLTDSQLFNSSALCSLAECGDCRCERQSQL